MEMPENKDLQEKIKQLEEEIRIIKLKLEEQLLPGTKNGGTCLSFRRSGSRF